MLRQKKFLPVTQWFSQTLWDPKHLTVVGTYFGRDEHVAVVFKRYQVLVKKRVQMSYKEKSILGIEPLGICRLSP
jgi:hypothetical protein